MVGQEPCWLQDSREGHELGSGMASPLGCWWSQMLLILTALQPAIFSILANNGSIACSPPFSSKARSQRKWGDERAAPPSRGVAWGLGMGVKAASNDPSPVPEMHVQLLIPQTFILVVLARMYYRKQDDKPGYQPVSFAPAGTDAKV